MIEDIYHSYLTHLEEQRERDVVVVMDTCKLILRKERKNDKSFDGIHPRTDQLN